MEKELKKELVGVGINVHTISVLEEQEIVSFRTFACLKEKHLDLLAKLVKLGQHAVLVNVWEQKQFDSIREDHHDESPISGSSSWCSDGTSSPFTSHVINHRSTSIASKESASVPNPKSTPYQRPNINRDRSPSLNEEIKSLAEMYKQKKSMDGSKIVRPKCDPRTLTIILGAMIYNGNKGVKQKEFQPNPRKITMAKTATLKDVFTKANELYFNLEIEDLPLLSSADSSGMKVKIEDPLNLRLNEYFISNNYQPSRHKVYVMYIKIEQVHDEQDIFGESSDEDEEKNEDNEQGISHTDPVASECSCGNKFYTFQMHQEPMPYCPDCDFSILGAMLNINCN